MHLGNKRSMSALCLAFFVFGCAKPGSNVMLVPKDKVELLERDRSGVMKKIGEADQPLDVIRCENIGKDDYVVVVRYEHREVLVVDGLYELVRDHAGPPNERTNSCG